MIELFARIPNAGEEVVFEKFVFKVQSVDMRRVKKVHVNVAIENNRDDEATN
jgi:Mg2+/Co2+ transporter CorC